MPLIATGNRATLKDARLLAALGEQFRKCNVYWVCEQSRMRSTGQS
jgi:hypothetical protein